MRLEDVNDVYDNNFIINKKLQIYAGLWPYDSYIHKLIRRVMMYSVLLVVMIPLGNGMRTWCGVKLEVCGENIAATLYILTIILKYFVTVLSERNLVKVYERLAKNWLQITNPQEHAILQEYARQGKIKTIGYLVYMVVAGFGFCQIPLIPVFLDFIMPLNESRPTVLFVKGEYIIDPNQYFYEIYAYFLLATFVTVISVTGIDTTYTVVVHQILGIFSIIKYRLQLATISFDQFRDISYDIIIESIKLHNEALQFIDLIETSYRLFFLILMGATVSFLSICVVVLMAMANEDILDTFRLAMVVFAVILHFLFNTWPGQKIIDHSHILFLSIYENEWYNISEKSKRLLRIMMLRCIKPCVITAGGLYVMNLENFGAIMRSAMSYVAFIASYR